MQSATCILRSQSANTFNTFEDPTLILVDDGKANDSILRSKSAATLLLGKIEIPAVSINEYSDEEKKEEESDIHLCERNLPIISRNGVSIPSYDRKALNAGILHIGTGNFHRAHAATYLDDLFQLDFANNNEWGIVGGGIMSFDAKKRELLQGQDWLQTLVARDGETNDARIIGSMIDFIPVDEDGSSLLKTMQSPSIKIVSMTVTEGGYFLNDGVFDPTHPQIQHDIANPNSPKTAFGMIVRALKLRKQAGTPPFTVLSCDNIPHNGDVVRSVLLGVASAIDKEFARWMEQNVACPNSMVDRITPATTDKQRQEVKETLGYKDQVPIFCEPYRQWVLEDNFPQGRPQLERLENVSIVSDVSPFEFMKIRILNGGHASMCYPAALLGVQYVHEAMEHSTIKSFLNALEKNEIIPTVGPVPGTTLEAYWKLIAERFSNPTINDTITRICFGGASNQPKFTIPVAADNLNGGRGVDGIALVSAMWCRYCQGSNEAGAIITANDPQWDRLQETALKASADPSIWLTELDDVYGATGKHPTFVASFTSALQTVQKEGAKEAMKKYVDKYM